MRVISGKCRGTKLDTPEGIQTRPTIDRIKETLFNMIAFDIPECSFLDLFSGSGAIGIESLSRGAKEVVFVENNPAALRCIQSNIEKTKLKTGAKIYTIDVLEALKQLGSKGHKFNIIFLDPPYHLETIQEVLEKIVTYDLLAHEGYVILERGTVYELTDVDGLSLIKEKKYKTTTLSFFERKEAL